MFVEKKNIQNMAQMLMYSDDPDILERAHVALDEANEATTVGVALGLLASERGSNSYPWAQKEEVSQE
jgi:hypothetical protein